MMAEVTEKRQLASRSPSAPPSPKRLKTGLPSSEASSGEKEEWPGWCTVESEPAIFNELLKEFGVTNAQVQEIYALDEDSLRALGPAHGMIFLFRWKPEPMDSTEDTCPEHVWFANQVIDNACASLALLNIVFNCDADIGPQLKSFKEFSAQLNPPMRGLAVANNKHIRNIHNSFARKMEMVDVDINLAEIACKKPRALGSSSDDVDPGIEVFHFIAYVHVDNALYELDGLKKQPVKLCTCPKEDWLVHAGPAVQERIASYGDEELLFNLLAIVPQSSPPDESFAEIARRRKVDYEAFAHKTATILARAGIAKKLCS